MDNVSRKANDRGKIRTLLGRACHFDLWQPVQFGVFKPLPLEQARKNYDEPLKRAFTYKALNKLIQGSAADMTKKSMVALYKNGIIPHIQIHDEVDISVESDKKAEQIVQIMEEAVVLQVPNKVDYESGENWGDIKQEETTMENIINQAKHLWTTRKKWVIGGAIIIVIAIIAI